MVRDEVLRSIKEAEEKTSAKLEKARSDASNIISKARGKSAEAISSGLQDAETEAQSMIDESRAAANKEADSVSADGQTSLAAIHKQGKKNRSPAVDLVIDAFLES